MSDLARKDEPAPNFAVEGELEDLFARCQDELLGTLYYLVGNLEDARDALQETFIKCWRHREKLPEVNNPRAWIFRIAMNTGRDIRQTAWRRKRNALPEDESTILSQGDGPVALAVQSERMSRLREALEQLRTEEREVFLLRQNGDMTYEEIAETLDLPTGTVKTRMRLALNKLREVLKES
ncbi:MAG: RNA polymerase sigma factor [Pirellulaceae bacterium]|nr:RNA polymerase sigma factor [Pirellulaceae bacterium]